MKRTPRFWLPLAIAIVLYAGTGARAELRMPKVFTDHMVLQQ